MEGTREGSSQTPRRTGARLGHARRVAVSPSPRLVANSFGGEGTQSQAAGEWPGGCGWSRILGDQELIRFLQTLRELGRPFCSLGCPVDSAGMLLANPSPLQIWVPGLQRDPGQLPRDTASPQPASRWTQVAGRHPWPTRAYLDRPGKEAAAREAQAGVWLPARVREEGWPPSTQTSEQGAPEPSRARPSACCVWDIPIPLTSPNPVPVQRQEAEHQPQPIPTHHGTRRGSQA